MAAITALLTQFSDAISSMWLFLSLQLIIDRFRYFRIHFLDFIKTVHILSPPFLFPSEICFLL